MSVQIMVTVSGSNQTDLIKILAEKTHALGGKWLNSKINHIDDYFAGLIKIQIEVDHVEKLIANFKALAINVESIVLGSIVPKKHMHLDLTIDARDRPGLVHDISEVLSDNSIRVENMECHRFGVADISGTVFTSHFKIDVNESFNEDELVNSLKEISSDLVIEVHEKL